MPFGLATLIVYLYLAATPANPPEVSADTTRVRLQWQAPAACPGGDSVARLAEALLLGSDTQIRASATVTATPPRGFVAEVRVEGADSRRWHGRSCEALAELTALVVAVAADPLAVAAAIEPIPRAKPVPGPTKRMAPRPTRGASPHSVPATPAITSPAPWRGFVMVQGVAGVAALPKLDAGLGLVGGFGQRRWQIEVQTAHLFARTASLPRFSEVEARVSLWVTSVLACGVLDQGRVGVGLCAGPELGLARAAARGVTTSTPASSLWVAGAGAANIDVALTHRISIRVGVQGLVALRRPTFAIRDDPTAALALGAGGMRATLGVIARFGPLRGVEDRG